jgi:hypothetical protein
MAALDCSRVPISSQSMISPSNVIEFDLKALP